MENPYLEKYKPEFEKIIEHLKQELSSIRTGRATPAMLDRVVVDAYGVKTPLNQLANINISDPKTLTIEPYDKNIIKDIEKAIQLADLGISPVNEGNIIRLSVPPLTEEKRKELVKILGEKAEQAKVSVKNLRDKIRDNITTAEKENEITEDDKYKSFADLDNLTQEYNQKIKEMAEKKEEEIMTI